MSCSIIQTIDSKECVGNSLVKINSNFSGLETAVCDLQSAASNVPVQGVIMYQGNISNFDENGRGKIETDVYLYGICNGNTYNDIVSPDLRDRFIVGAGNQYALGDNGGLSAVKLAVKDLPAHSHTYTDAVVYGKNTKDAEAGHSDTNFEGYTDSLNKTTGNTGAGHAHENRPPYYALYYIIKIA
jgi:microcystin-dependent protein